MADTIKLEVLDALEAELTAITDIKYLQMNPIAVHELSQVQYPFAAAFDIDEVTETGHNRIEFGTFPFHIQIWCQGENYQRQAENIRGQIKRAFYTSVPLLKTLATKVKERSSTKFYLEDDVYGGLMLNYDITYISNRLNSQSQSY